MMNNIDFKKEVMEELKKNYETEIYVNPDVNLINGNYVQILSLTCSLLNTIKEEFGTSALEIISELINNDK